MMDGDEVFVFYRLDLDLVVFVRCLKMCIRDRLCAVALNEKSVPWR